MSFISGGDSHTHGSCPAIVSKETLFLGLFGVLKPRVLSQPFCLRLFNLRAEARVASALLQTGKQPSVWSPRRLLFIHTRESGPIPGP